MCRYCTMMDDIKQEENFEPLKDSRFPWAERKWKAVKLAGLYSAAGYDEYADRAAACASWMQFNATADGSKRTLRSANFCQLRLCPMCMARRARKSSYKLSQIMTYVEHEHNCRFLFLTLTVKNCIGTDLSNTIKRIISSWHKLIRHRRFERVVGGWFRALEVTRNAENDTYHPHIHAIIAVPMDYIRKNNPDYITHKMWMQHWRTACGLDYDPRVRISAVRGRRRETDTDAPSQAASKEAAKYVTKEVEYIDDRLDVVEAAGILKTYTDALYRKRLVAFGGWLKDAARLFDADDLDAPADLIHADEDSIRDDLAEMIEIYHWSLGAGDYILSARQINPELICLETGEVRIPVDVPIPPTFDREIESSLAMEAQRRALVDEMQREGMQFDDIHAELQN